VKLFLKRVQFDNDVTIGELSVDGKFQCWVCEDTVRSEGSEKIHGKTAIPAGTYDVYVTFSNRFQRMLPLLINVPNFEGIRIHPGNTSEDTDGCLLPGIERLSKGVGASRVAFNLLFEKINGAKMRMEQVTIEIQNGDLA
jgi:hypothetical protein